MVAICDATGTKILTRPFDASGIRLWGEDPILVQFHPFANCDYTAQITIEQGAVSLGDAPRTLYARNDLCGMELFPAYVLGTISAVSTLIACAVGYHVLPILVREGFHVRVPDDAGRP